MLHDPRIVVISNAADTAAAAINGTPSRPPVHHSHAVANIGTARTSRSRLPTLRVVTIRIRNDLLCICFTTPLLDHRDIDVAILVWYDLERCVMVQKHSTLLSWDDLAAVLSVATSLSIRAAAEDQSVAHTTLARRVAAAEAALGVVLFVRSTSGLALTAAGEKLLPHISHMAEEADALRRTVAGGDTSPRGTVRISLPPALLKYCLAPALPQFLKLNPLVSLDFDTRHDFANLDRHEADIAVRYQASPEPHLIGTRVGTSQESAYVTPLVGQAMKQGVRPLLVGWSRGEVFRRRAAALDLAEHDIGFVCPDLHGQVALAEQGLGIAILPHIVGDKSAGLQRITPHKSVATTHVWVLLHENLRHSARIRAAADFLKHQLRQALAPDMPELKRAAGGGS